MKTFIGTGVGQPEAAVHQAVQGLTSPSAILFMASYEHFKETASRLKELFPDTPCIGTIGTRLVNGQVNDSGLAVLGFFSDVKIRCGIITEASRCPVAGTTQLLKQIAEISPGTDDTVCVEYCTGSEEKLVTTFTSCLETKGIHLAGGTVFGVPDGKPPVVAYNGELYEDACVYALIKNTTGKIRVYKENIYEKTSAQSHFATKVDVSRKALIELDGRPAADVYSAELGIPRDKIVDNVLVNPMGRAVGNQVFISSMNGMDTDGTLTNYKRINKNDCIYFLSLGDYKATEQQTRQQIQQDASHISLVLSIDCIYRYLLYEKEGLVSMTGTFIDTIVICTLTGLSIVLTGAWQVDGLEGVQVTTYAFQNGLPFPHVVSSFVLMMCLVFFAFTTILGWDYYSERCLEYLTGGNMKKVMVFRWIYILAVFIGPYMTVSAVWTIADIFNGLMALPNMIALFALNGVVVYETKKFFEAGKHKK